MTKVVIIKGTSSPWASVDPGTCEVGIFICLLLMRKTKFLGAPDCC